MMFRIACDHRDGAAGRYAGGDDPLVYLVSSVDRLIAARLFTDDHVGVAAERLRQRSLLPA